MNISDETMKTIIYCALYERPFADSIYVLRRYGVNNISVKS